MAERLMSLAGIAVILGLCVLLSRDRKRISWRVVAWGLGLQFLFAAILLKTKPDWLYEKSRLFFEKLDFFAAQGSGFLFGPLAKTQGFVILNIGALVIFVSALMAVLYYLRVIQFFVYILARIMQATMRVSGAECLSSAIQIFMGIEGVTGLKAYIPKMTRSELFTLMTTFMANLAGSVMAAYVVFFKASPVHILTASIMSAPVSIMLSKMLIPETETPETAGRIEWSSMKPEEDNIIEAASNGAIDGVRLTAYIAAMILAFIALIYAADYLLGFAHTSFTQLAGYVFSPVAFLLGVPWADCAEAGKLLAIKVIFNEWISYQQLGELAAKGEISRRAVMIITYALCGFANFGSLGILIGGVSGLAPGRRKDVTSLGLKALLAGLLTGLLNAAVAGLLLSE